MRPYDHFAGEVAPVHLHEELAAPPPLAAPATTFATTVSRPCSIAATAACSVQEPIPPATQGR